MQNIFSHDISKALRIGFGYCQLGMFSDEMLRILVRLTSLFFDLLENYSQGKTLNIKTSKLLKRKAAAAKKKKKAKEQKGDEGEETPGEEPQQEEG